MPAVIETKITPQLVVLTGNPNCGKTTIFNALTGLRAKIGNYAGVTVERKEGRLIGSSKENPMLVLDLPGTYSLSPQSLDEQISRDVLFHRLPDVARPSLVIIVVDASNLERNLYYATQVIELGYPVVVALNMMDVAADNGREIDVEQLARLLGAPVVPLVASQGKGVPELREQIIRSLRSSDGISSPVLYCDLPEVYRPEIELISQELEKATPQRSVRAQSEALLLLADERSLATNGSTYPASLRRTVEAARNRLEAAGVTWRSAVIEGRYARMAAIQSAVTTEVAVVHETVSDKLDRILTHRIWGMVVFVAIMVLMFQSIFTLAEIPMTLLDSGMSTVGDWVTWLIPPGELHSLLEDGVIAGVGAVVVFLPQICLLFLFIGLLEDTGYMARAAFLMDRIMSKVGLHGKSFIPLLSSFACAIPGILATRTIESPKDRLVTTLVAPLMACSARLPVYTLLIAACIPNQKVLGFFKLPGLTLFSMYILGIVAALGMAWLFKKTILKGEPPLLIMELPPYKRPAFKMVMRHMWDRSKTFLQRAGTIILGINILLWFLATYPHDRQREQKYETQRQVVRQAAANTTPGEAQAAQLAEIDRREASDALHHSIAGTLGRLIEPVIAPLGMDWKIGIGIVASFAAREVFVSTMSTVYSVGESGASDNDNQNLAQTLRQQTRADGTPLYTPLLALTLMVFYVFALQCASTVVVVRRETLSWKWPLFQWAYMGLLAWTMAFITYRGGLLLGWQ